LLVVFKEYISDARSHERQTDDTRLVTNFPDIITVNVVSLAKSFGHINLCFNRPSYVSVRPWWWKKTFLWNFKNSSLPHGAAKSQLWH